MPTIRLTQRRIDALRPRRKVRDFRDAELKGYGVRVMPSSAKALLHSHPIPGMPRLEDPGRRGDTERGRGAHPGQGDARRPPRRPRA